MADYERTEADERLLTYALATWGVAARKRGLVIWDAEASSQRISVNRMGASTQWPHMISVLELESIRDVDWIFDWVARKMGNRD